MQFKKLQIFLVVLLLISLLGHLSAKETIKKDPLKSSEIKEKDDKKVPREETSESHHKITFKWKRNRVYGHRWHSVVEG